MPLQDCLRGDLVRIRIRIKKGPLKGLVDVRRDSGRRASLGEGHLDLTKNGCCAVDVPEGSIHFELLVQVLATVKAFAADHGVRVRMLTVYWDQDSRQRWVISSI